MNKKQIAAVAAYCTAHFLIAGLCIAYTDPLGILIVFIGTPFAAAGAAGAISGKYGFWSHWRHRQLPLVLLGALLLSLEIAVRSIYGFTMFAMLMNPVVLFIVAVQYGCCFLTLLILRWGIDKLADAEPPAEVE